MTRMTPQQIVEALLEAGQTQVSIQNATGIPQGTISRIMTGKSKDPRNSTVDKLRAYLTEVTERSGDEPSSSAA